MMLTQMPVRLPCRLPWTCLSEEHYHPVVLAVAGASEETSCRGNALHVDWGRAGPTAAHPFMYGPQVRCPLSSGMQPT